MDRLRQWVLLSVLAAAVVLAGGWVLLVSPEKGEAAALRDEVASQEQLNAQSQTRLQVLRDKAEGLPQQEAELAEVTAKIPEQVGLPGLIRAVTAAARESGVDLVTVTPGTATALTDAAAPAAGAAVAPTTTAPDTTTATTTSATAPAAAGDGVSAVPVSLVVTGTYYDTEEFVARLEELPRALRITGLSLAPTQTGTAASSSTVLSSTISGVVFVRGSAAAPGAAPGTAPATGTVPAPAVTTEQPPAGAS